MASDRLSGLHLFGRQGKAEPTQTGEFISRLAITVEGCHEMALPRHQPSYLKTKPGEVIFFDRGVENHNSNAVQRKVVTFLFFRSDTQINVVEHLGDPKVPVSLNVIRIDALPDLGWTLLKGLSQCCESDRQVFVAELLVKGLIELIIRQMDQPQTIRQNPNAGLWNIIEADVVENLHLNLSIHELAARHSLHPKKISILCKSFTGMSYVTWLNHQKIERACVLLKQNHAKGYKIGQSLGYEDPNYFSRQFKQVMGCNTREYLKQLKSR